MTVKTRRTGGWAQIGFAMAFVGAFSLMTSTEAAAGKRNESRWFLQNVCMANAVALMGKPDVKYTKEAKASRQRLKSRGVPEAHLREMENFAKKMIHSTTTPENVDEGPRLCIQLYKT